MVEAADSYVWLVFPLVLRTLGQDDDPAELLQGAREAGANDLARLQRVVTVCARLDLIDRLRSGRTEVAEPEYGDSHAQDIDQLAGYLAVTCVSIATGEEAPGTDSLLRFLGELPEWLQQWLPDTYVVLRGGSDPAAAAAEWQQLDYREKCARIATHLAATAVRYPATVDYAPWDWHDRMHLLGSKRPSGPYQFTTLREHGDFNGPVEVGVGLKDGLSESEILRLLLVVSLRSWLGFSADPPFAQRYWAHRGWRYRVLELLRELEDNLSHLHGWAGHRLHPRAAKADYLPLAGLPDEAARALLARGDDFAAFALPSHVNPEAQPSGAPPAGTASSLTALQGPMELLTAYVHGLERINERIIEFNDRYEDPAADLGAKGRGEADLFARIVRDRHTHELVACMEQLHRDLSRQTS